MNINDRAFPVVVQAYQNNGTEDLFVAEQVVNNQVQADQFTSRFAGYLIKARTLNETEIQTNRTTVTNQVPRKRGVSAAAIILLLLVALVIVGFTTGWIQHTFNLQLTIMPTDLYNILV